MKVNLLLNLEISVQPFLSAYFVFSNSSKFYLIEAIKKKLYLIKYFLEIDIKLGGVGDESKAEMIYDLLIKRDSRAQGEILASMITLYGKQQKLEKVKALFAAVVNSDICGTEIYNSVIDACVNCGDPGEGYQVYKESTKRGITLSPIIISVLVNNLTNRGMFWVIFIHSKFFICLHVKTKMLTRQNITAYMSKHRHKDKILYLLSYLTGRAKFC